MDMGTSSMDMAMSTATATGDMASMVMTATASAASATKSAMSMSMGGSCKISMLWNWNTIDSCFIAKSWRITSKGMFAGSCIGVILLVMALEFFRRLGKEYDRYILRAHLAALPPTSSIPSGSNGTSRTPSNPDDASASKTASVAVGGVGAFGAAGVGAGARDFRPGVAQQAIRALLHVVQFTIAYFVMLLAMYYNGYIIICIFIGAYIGSFVFSWERIRFEGPREEVTVCCG